MLRYRHTSADRRGQQPRACPARPRTWFNQVAKLTLACGLYLASPVAADEEPWEISADERVVFLGDGLLEQAQYSGWTELMLRLAFPDGSLHFRNLGWNGDTPSGRSRCGLSLLQAGREPPDEGWKQLQKQLELTQPSLLICGYGMSSALEGQPLQDFMEEYGQLLDRARQISPHVRFVLLGPLQHLDPTHPLSDRLTAYSEAIRGFAEAQAARFLDLSQVGLRAEFRQDAIHLNEQGYRALARAIARQLGISADWERHPRAESIRQAILRKNQWWFHRSRPANMAYVFGFRRREQGQNAGEIPQFDALVATEEQRILQLVRSDAADLPAMPKPRLQSKYAKFTAQPVPEFNLPEGWEITLWAQNPDLNKPIQMNFDPQGRLWVASSEAYPMIEVGQSAPDKIIVLEDTNEDGKADRSQVFADGLLIPTGVVPGNGGVYVAQSTDLLFLEDTDGDGQADRRRRLLSGFGTEDTHHNLHTLRWGPDGRLYMNQSVYTRTDAETPHGVVRLKAGGGFRLAPRTLEMDIFFRGLWNSWGHQFDAWGNSFLTDGAGFSGLAYTFPGATFHPTPGVQKPLKLISPGNWPKFAALEIIQGPSYPADWQGTLVTCDFRANRVTRFSLADQGAGFVTRPEPDVVRSSATTFRPIDVKLGPDGALYVADWSNPIINHGEVDFRDPRRDRWHGRIWRLKWRKASHKPIVDLTTLPTQSLLDRLIGEDGYDRDQARRVLTERGASILPAVRTWLAQRSEDAERLQGLWLLASLEVPHDLLLKQLLGSSQPQVRAAATRVLTSVTTSGTRESGTVTQGTLARLQRLTEDGAPRVRLEAVRGLARLGTAEAGQAAFAVLEHPTDRFLDHALRLTIRELAEPMLSAWESGSLSLTDRAARPQLEAMLTAVPTTRAAAALRTYLLAHPLEEDLDGPWIDLIGRVGDEALLSQIFELGLAPSAEATVHQRTLQALLQAERLRKQRPAAPLQMIGGFLKHNVPAATQRLAVELAGQWSMRELFPKIAALAERAGVDESVLVQVISTLEAFRGDQAADALERLCQHPSTIVRQRACGALSLVAPQRVGTPLWALLRENNGGAGSDELWRSVLRSEIAIGVIAGMIQQTELPQSALESGLKAARARGKAAESLVDLLERRMRGTTSNAAKTDAELVELARDLAEGDPTRGEYVYRRQDLACSTCHAIGGVGGRVGPDLTSLGASAPIDYLIESLYRPNAKIKEGFHSVTVLTEDGITVTGVEIASTTEEIVLRDANNRRVTLPVADVIEKQNGPSLMPSGMLEKTSRQEQLDLLSFLSHLGKPGDFDASQPGFAREFQLLAGTHRVEQQGTDAITAGQAKAWRSIATRVRGDLPRALIEDATRTPTNISLVHVYAKTTIDVATPGPVRFEVPAPSIAMWVDGQPISGPLFESKLTSGTHVVVLRLDARNLPSELWLRSADAAFVSP